MIIELNASLHNFNPDHFGSVSDFRTPAEVNQRDTLIFACSDHGTAPDNISIVSNDRVLIMQHIGESIPRPEDESVDDLFESIRKLFDDHHIQQVIVCGHLGCNVLRNWLKDSECSDTGMLRARFRAAAFATVNEAYEGLSEKEFYDYLICEHALYQLENLQSHPFIHNKLIAGELKLHAWIADDKSARVLQYDPTSGNMVSGE